jgi:hypothetical protein
LRHYFTFLLFYVSVIFFYFLSKNIFQSWKLGLLGSVFLVLSPRIFADSFYNPKDLPFLSAFIIAVFTLQRYLKNKNASFALFHGLATGFAAGIRIIGILIPFFTILLFTLDIVAGKNINNKNMLSKNVFSQKQNRDPGNMPQDRGQGQEELDKQQDTENIQQGLGNLQQYPGKQETFNQAKSLLVYLFVSITVFLFFMHSLYPKPLGNFMSDFPYDTPNFLYLGQYISSIDPPWHYLPVNILIMTPILYSLLFFTGMAYFFSGFKKRVAIFYPENKYIAIAILWFFMPILAAILLHSNMYNGWRQMYFIYPALLILSLNGVRFLYNYFKDRLNSRRYYLVSLILTLIFFINSVFFIQLMVRQHPYQYVYHNILAGKNLKEVKEKFILDYWGLSYKDGLEYILKTDDRERIKVTEIGCGNETREYLLTESDNTKLVFVQNIDDAEYLLINYKSDDANLDLKNKVYSLIVNEGEILSVYKLK